MGSGRMSELMTEASGTFDDAVVEYVTVMLDGQLFGLPIGRVQDVFMPDRLTRVPLAPPEISGVLNLRGRIVTAVDLRLRLGMAPRGDGRPPMAVGIELRGESYGLLIDAVGEVMKLANGTREANPVNLDARLARWPRSASRPSPKTSRTTRCRRTST